MNRYWENVLRHVSSTIMGMVLLSSAVGMAVLVLFMGWVVSVLNIVMIAVFLGAGAYMLGAEGLITELAKFISGVNAIFGALFNGKKT